MAHPSYFGDKKPEVLKFVKRLSKEYREDDNPLSLTQIAKKVRAEFKLAPVPKVEKKPTGKGKPKKPVDPLKMVVYRLCNSNGIWFGRPEKEPSRLKAAK